MKFKIGECVQYSENELPSDFDDLAKSELEIIEDAGGIGIVTKIFEEEMHYPYIVHFGDSPVELAECEMIAL
jgi:hypothetical protein